MKNNHIPALCGGTFFTLILTGLKKGPSKSEQRDKCVSTKLSEPEVLEALVKVIYPEFYTLKESFATMTTGYKSCTKNTSNIGLDDSVIQKFNDRIVSNNHSADLVRMAKFIEGYLSVSGSQNKDVDLVKALLELVELDTTIAQNQYLYVSVSLNGVTKNSLPFTTDFSLPHFLLGVWHFALVERKDNSVGKATFDKWCPTSSIERTKREYKGTMGKNIVRNINVMAVLSNEIKTAALNNSPEPEEAKSTANDRTNNFECAEELMPRTSSDQKATVIMNQYGNGTQIGHVANLSITNNK